MTAYNGPVTLNAGSGSDTLASGLGPATAVNGSGASTNNTTTVDLSADTPDLSGVSAGDLLWVDSSSGLKFSVIASVDDGADTVTTDDTWTQTESSRNWAIGGKRATLGGVTNLIQYNQGVAIELEDNQTITSRISQASGSRSGTLTIQSDTEGTTRTIEANGFNTNALYLYQNTDLIDLKLQYDATQTGISREFLFTRNNLVKLIRCTSQDCYRLQEGQVTNGTVVFVDCDLSDSSITYVADINGSVFAVGSSFRGIVQCSGIDYPSFFLGCAFIKGGSGTSIAASSNGDLNYIANCVFDDAGTGIDSGRGLVAVNNIFIDCGTAIQTDSNNEFSANCGNAFYNNTTDTTHTSVATADTVSLTTDPFTDSANNDYTLNSTAGGGAACKDVGFPNQDVLGGTRNQNIGMYGETSGGGGGGSFTRISLNGGMDG